MQPSNASFSFGALRAQDANAQLFDGIRESDKQAVVLKMLEPAPATAELLLQHELRITQILRGNSSVLQAYAWFRAANGPALVLEHFSSQTLHDISPVDDCSAFLRLACALTAALAQVHAQRIVHKNINPRNVLVGPDGAVKITNFAAAAHLRSEQQAVGNLSFVEGALAFISPEQTGRMNRPVDCRSDLYSLGMTLYYALCGKLPFSANDPLEWIHCHIAKVPPPPSTQRTGVPAMIDAIILRLLAKGSEERYQTADGLLFDLQRCQEAWQGNQTIAPFELRSRDASAELSIPSKLYGREAEVESLLVGFDRLVASGQPEVMTIRGPSGLGKSSLVYELYKPIVRERGLFIAGKFDQYQRHVPYSSIAAALRDLLQQILAEPQDRLEAWRGKLERALGSNGGVITQVVPQFVQLLGPQPPLAEMGPAETQNRFKRVFRNFLGAFADGGRPLVIFLDDMQWADNATLDLLEATLGSNDARYVFFLLAYRDNEVPATHPFALMMERLTKVELNWMDVELAPLSADSITTMVCETLRCDAARAAPLVQLIAKKTAGNPFFVSEFIKTLHRENLLVFAEDKRQWTWNQATIEAQNITDNVVQLMIERLRRLEPSTSQALSLAACIGNTFTVDELALIHERDAMATMEGLRDAHDHGLIIKLSPPHLSNAVYKFQHDRIQQAAYALIPEAEKMPVHLEIGRRIRDNTESHALDSQVFSIVNQLNRAHTLITGDERINLLELNVKAGRKAKTSTAFTAAQIYFHTATELLPDDAWETRYAQTFSIYTELAECEYLSRAIDEAQRLFAKLAEKAATPSEKAGVYHLQIRLLQSAGHYDTAAGLCCEAFNLFGLDMPEQPDAAAACMETERARIAEVYAGKSIEFVRDLPRMTHPEMRSHVELLEVSCAPLYISKPFMFPVAVLKMTRLSLEHGNCDASCYGYVCYGLLLASLYDDVTTGYAFGEMAVYLNEVFGDTQRRGAITHVFADHVRFWKEPVRDGLPILERAFLACQEVGDFEYANFICFQRSWQLFESGMPLGEVRASVQRYRDFAKQSHAIAVQEVIHCQQQLCKVLEGATASLRDFDDDDFDSSASNGRIAAANFNMGRAFADVMRLAAATLAGDWSTAWALAQECERGSAYMLSTPAHVSFIFYQALTAAELCATDSSIREVLERNTASLERWAQRGTPDMQAKALLARAEALRATAKVGEALPLYEEAIAAAQRGGLPQHEALACELAGRAYEALKIPKFALHYRRNARRMYGLWGASGKVAALEAAYPDIRNDSSASGAAAPLHDEEQLDLLSVLKASQSLSSEMDPKRLLDTMMGIVVEYAGAQRGCLIVEEDGELVVGARVNLGQKSAADTQVCGSIVPMQVVQAVQTQRSKVLLSDARCSPQFSHDAYIERAQPKSVLCIPIVRQARFIGIIYLENNLLVGAFSAEHLRTLEMLASQLAISIDNARLYQASQAAIRARDEFLCVASHELKTPLTPLKLQFDAFSRAVHKGVAWTPDRVARLVTMADGQLQRLTQLVNDLLDVSSGGADSLALHYEDFDLADAVRTVATQRGPALEAAGCPLEITAEAAPGRWDRAQVQRVLHNLLENAAKYAPGAPLAIQVGSFEGAARIVIRDHGPGVAPQHQTKIFERFDRAGASVNSGGLGLGLYIGRQIALAHGGDIRVHTPNDGGAAFTVTLPTVPPSRTKNAPTPTGNLSRS